MSIPYVANEHRDNSSVIQDISAIVLATAAVIGLVPLGVRSIHDMVRNHRHKKNSEMWTTVLVSVVASHIAPPVLTEVMQRLGAVAEELPAWAKAALGALPQQSPAPGAEEPAGKETERPMHESSQDGRKPSENGEMNPSSLLRRCISLQHPAR